MTVQDFIDRYHTNSRAAAVWLSHNLHFIDTLVVYADQSGYTDLDPSNRGEFIYRIANSIVDRPACVICKAPTLFKQASVGFTKTCCTPQCNSALRVSNEYRERYRQTCLSKYGVESPNQAQHIKESKKRSYVAKYGVENPFQSPEIKELIRDRMIERHGVDNFAKTNECAERTQQTNLERYGVPYHLSLASIRDSIRQTCQSRYGVDNPASTEHVKAKIAKVMISKYGTKTYKESKAAKEKYLISMMEKYPDVIGYEDGMLLLKCDDDCECGGTYKLPSHIYRSRLSIYQTETCPAKRPKQIGISSYELQLRSFLDEHGIAYETRNRTILNGLEGDIFIPGHNLIIEFNGLYWHSEVFLDKGYHRNKTLIAHSKSIDIFHIWEDDFTIKRNVIFNMLKARLGLATKIGARKCTVAEVSNNDAALFLNQYHLQGDTKASVRIGLYYQGNLVSLCTFKRTGKTEDEWELSRFVSADSITVIGGFSRLLSRFIATYQPGSIITYANADHSTGDVYHKSGFTPIGMTSPGYYWVVNGRRHNRMNFTKSRLKKFPVWSAEKTEVEIMHSMGYYRIWNSGSYSFKLTIND